MMLGLKAFFHAGLLVAGCYLGFTCQPTVSVPAQANAQATEAQPKPASPSVVKPVPAVQQPKKTAKDFNSLGPADFPDALKRALAHPIPAERNQQLGWLFAAWARVDRAAALAALMQLKSPQAQAGAVGAVLREWVKLDAPAAWRWAASLPAESGLAVKVVAALLEASADSDPQHYAAWAAALEDPLLRVRALDTVAAKWAQRDVRQALDWIRQLEPATLRDPLLRKHVWPSAQMPLLDKLDLALQWPDRSVRLHHTAFLLEGWASRDGRAAFQWLITQPMTPDLQVSCATLGSALREQMPVAELQGLARRLLEVPHRHAFIAGAIGMHPFGTRSDPDRGKALLPLLGQGFERTVVLVGIGEGLAKRQQAQAETWVRSLPPGVDRDAAIGGMAMGLVERNQHGAALDWLAQTRTALPEMSEMFDRTFKTWRKDDPGKAQAWLNSSTRLSDEQRGRLRALINEGP